jgi:cell division protein FtsL
MIKLLLCTFAAFTVAVIVLQLRQERREIAYQANTLHDKIEAQQSKLWNQQLQIAIYTAPNAISQTVGNHDLKIAPIQPR